MRVIGTVPVWLLLAATGWAIWVPSRAIAGANLLAVEDFGNVPDARAPGRDSLLGDGVIYSFEERARDFGRIIVRSHVPNSVVRRDLFVGFEQGSLVVDARPRAGRPRVRIDAVEIWLRINGELRSEGSYEWELAATGPDGRPIFGIPAVVPFFWADGTRGGAAVTVAMPPSDGDEVRRMMHPRGEVQLHAFLRQTGVAWVVLKPAIFDGRIAITRAVFREIDSAETQGHAGMMPAPVSYVPIRNPIDRRVDEAVHRGAEVLLNTLDAEGYWPDPDIEARIRLTAAAVTAFVAVGYEKEMWLSSVDWLAEQPRDEPLPWRTDTLAARLACVARFGDFQSNRRELQADTAALADAQAPSGGWDRDRPDAAGAGALPLGTDHRVTAAVIAALEDARHAGAAVDPRLWRRAMQYWTDAQLYGGGFGRRLERFGGLGDAPSVVGTARGAYALMASLDMAAGFEGRHCSTYRSSPRQLEAIQQAIAWLDVNVGESERRIGTAVTPEGSLAQADALQQLGATFGVTTLNGADHLAESFRNLLDHFDAETGMFGVRGGDGWQEKPSLWQTARAVSVLAAGSAPVLLQRAIVGDAPEGFGEFKADLSHLVRALSPAGQPPLRWRRTSLDRPLGRLLDVPILVVSVVGPFEWSQRQWQTLREYCLGGGTVVLIIGDHAAALREQVMVGIDRTFPEYELRIPKPDERVLGGADREDPPPMRVLGNGFREFLFLPDDDWSCQWHLSEPDPRSRAFMRRLVDCVTDGDLASVERSKEGRSLGADAAFSATAAHLEIGRKRPVYPDLLPALDRLARDRFRLSVDAVDDGSSPDLLWVSVTGDRPPDESALAKIRRAIDGGAFVFVDVVSGNPAWDRTARQWIGTLGVSVRAMRGIEPIYTGDLSGTRGFDVMEVAFRPALHTPFAKSGRCPLDELVRADRAVGIYCPVDVASGIGRHRFPGCRGPAPASACDLAMNVLLRAYGHKLARHRSPDGVLGGGR